MNSDQVRAEVALARRERRAISTQAARAIASWWISASQRDEAITAFATGHSHMYGLLSAVRELSTQADKRRKDTMENATRYTLEERKEYRFDASSLRALLAWCEANPVTKTVYESLVYLDGDGYDAFEAVAYPEQEGVSVGLPDGEAAFAYLMGRMPSEPTGEEPRDNCNLIWGYVNEWREGEFLAKWSVGYSMAALWRIHTVTEGKEED